MRNILLAFLSFLLFGCSSKTYDVPTAAKTISFSKTDWKEMENPVSFAKNFEARKKRNTETFPQVITVFLEPMASEKKVGRVLSDSEYIEVFTSVPNMTTARIRVDKGSYWLLSRQTFKTMGSTFGDLNQEEIEKFLRLFEEDIKETRYKLKNL